MTYFGFLAIFVGIPLLGVLLWNQRDARKGLALPTDLQTWSPWVVIWGHVIVAVLYTTPWDNYLVATRVWWYDPALVTGLLIGWVPIEEYTFFVVQTLLVGVALLLVLRRQPVKTPFVPNLQLRIGATLGAGLLWFVSVCFLVLNIRAGTYFGLEMGWALLPIMFQLAFGADILWHYRRPVLGVLLGFTAYLSFADTLAIASGTWTIDPAQSFNIFLPGGLPIEELIFFFLTCTLVCFGVTLVLAEMSQQRAAPALKYCPPVLQRFLPST